VAFTSGGLVLCTATLSATSCTTSVTLPAGTYPVQATYSGDGNYNGSTAAGIGQDGVFSVIDAMTTPAVGSGPMGQKALLGTFLVIVGTCLVGVSRRRSRQSAII
jgi:hypothetical protein